MERKVFSRRVALITGGVKRLGFTIARAIAAEGAEIIVTYFQSAPAEVKRAVAELERAGAETAHAYKCDLASLKSLRAFCAALERKHPRIDYLVNSAATFPREKFFEASPATFDATFALNARAPFFLSQYVAIGMKRDGFGRIINIADVAAYLPWPSYLAYSMSKAAVVAMTKGLAKALAPEILVNAIAPGPVLLPEHYDSMDLKKAVEPTVLKRQGAPEDVASAVVFLLQSDYITGSTLPVDGGRMIR